jgi:ABC-type multidrug transport system ATPase subunit
MHTDLSVKETLSFYARLRLPYHYSEKRKLGVVLDVMNILEVGHDPTVNES